MTIYDIGDLSDKGIPSGLLDEAGAIPDDTLQRIQNILDTINNIISHPLVAPMIPRIFPNAANYLHQGKGNPQSAQPVSAPIPDLDVNSIMRLGIRSLCDYLIENGNGDKTIGDLLTELAPVTINQARDIFK